MLLWQDNCFIQKAEDAEELQASLDRMCAWTENWGMAFNIEKCHVMHIGLHNPKLNYHMNGKSLSKTENERDIGVMVSNNLKPAQQCRKAAQAASAVLGQITRAFHYRDRHVFLSLYQQYVRRHLEFAVAAWAPWTRTDIDCLENVQRRAVRAISGLKGASYEEKLKEIGLPSLEDRRKEIDLVQAYKTVNCDEKGDCELGFVRADNRRPTRNGAGRDKLLVKRANHEYRRNYFSLRVIDDWNELPDTVKEARNVSAFKRLYRRHRDAMVTFIRDTAQSSGN